MQQTLRSVLSSVSGVKCKLESQSGVSVQVGPSERVGLRFGLLCKHGVGGLTSSIFDDPAVLLWTERHTSTL